jgi:hypothetical protein
VFNLKIRIKCTVLAPEICAARSLSTAGSSNTGLTQYCAGSKTEYPAFPVEQTARIVGNEVLTSVIDGRKDEL